MTPASPLDDRIEANSRCQMQVDGLVTPKYWNQARVTSITSTAKTDVVYEYICMQVKPTV